MIVEDLMTRDPISVTESASLLSADERMKVARVRHMPVVRGRRIVGLLTHRDVLSASLSQVAQVDSDVREDLLSGIPVSEVMEPQLITVRASTSVVEAIDLMLSRKLGCLPVVDAGDELIGILTESDFLKLTRALLQATEVELIP